MNITAKITGIKYKPLLIDDLHQIDILSYNVNTAPSSCLVKCKDDNHQLFRRTIFFDGR